VAHAFWHEFFPEVTVRNMWCTVYRLFKHPDIVEIDFRLCHTTIYTNRKLFRIGNVDSELCSVCKLVPDDIDNMFLHCNELQQARAFIIDVLENLFRNAPVHYVNSLHFDQLLLLGYLNTCTGVNESFVNYVLSIARFCIYTTESYHYC
jgi:hypothetical protein